MLCFASEKDWMIILLDMFWIEVKKIFNSRDHRSYKKIINKWWQTECHHEWNKSNLNESSNCLRVQKRRKREKLPKKTMTSNPVNVQIWSPQCSVRSEEKRLRICNMKWWITFAKANFSDESNLLSKIFISNRIKFQIKIIIVSMNIAQLQNNYLHKWIAC